MGYVSAWAKKCFCDISDKNAFYETFGKTLEPKQIALLKVNARMAPEQILKTIEAL
jgi:hypothetical protein